MKNLLLLALLAFAAWYGWNHKDELLHRRAGHDAVIENHTGKTMERIRLTVDGQTLVKESLADEATAVLPFKVNNDAEFVLTWQYATQPGEQSWRGGSVPKGPLLQRHIFSLDGDGAVYYRAEPKLASK
jgi:hypothetical protein